MVRPLHRKFACVVKIQKVIQFQLTLQFCIQLQGAKAKKVTLQDVMEGILLSAGPVCNNRALRASGMRFRHVSAEQFQKAANELQHSNLCFLKEITTAGRPASVFIKTGPGGTEELISHTFGHLLPTYPERFRKKCPKAISKKVRQNLVSQGLIDRKIFNFKFHKAGKC